MADPLVLLSEAFAGRTTEHEVRLTEVFCPSWRQRWWPYWNLTRDRCSHYGGRLERPIMHSVAVIGTSAVELNMSPTSTSHPFVPPGSSDLRSPCPALNALANHGYMYVVIFLSRRSNSESNLCQ